MSDWILRFHILKSLIREAWRYYLDYHELDAPICCDGRECGCQGSSIREFWEFELMTQEQKEVWRMENHHE